MYDNNRIKSSPTVNIQQNMIGYNTIFPTLVDLLVINWFSFPTWLDFSVAFSERNSHLVC